MDTKKYVSSIFIVFVGCMLCASGMLHSGPIRFIRGGKKISSLLKRTQQQISRQVAVARRTSTPSPKPVRSSVPTAKPTPVPVVKLAPVPVRSQPWFTEEATTINTLSRPMQRRIAREARAFLDEIEEVRPPDQPASYQDVNRGIYTLGNLTRMSEEQFALGKKIYMQAVEYMQEVSKSINAEIYYLGTSEMEALHPEQIRQRLSEITKGKQLVADARTIWGDRYVLMRIASYWQHMQNVYSSLGTGVYNVMEHVKLEAIKREDGHVYVEKEFGLISEGEKVEIPQADWKDPRVWFGQQVPETLPARLRVAVLQDDRDVIASLKKMKASAGLKGWTFDIYDDPETFLNQVSYNKYDMILTDVLIQNGGGRYLARQLRSRGYEGSILTLSGFEVAHGGEDFFNDGIDGMIGLGWSPNLTERIWSRLNNYFILKQKYGWKH